MFGLPNLTFFFYGNKRVLTFIVSTWTNCEITLFLQGDLNPFCCQPAEGLPERDFSIFYIRQNAFQEIEMDLPTSSKATHGYDFTPNFVIGSFIGTSRNPTSTSSFPDQVALMACSTSFGCCVRLPNLPPMPNGYKFGVSSFSGLFRQICVCCTHLQFLQRNRGFKSA